MLGFRIIVKTMAGQCTKGHLALRAQKKGKIAIDNLCPKVGTGCQLSKYCAMIILFLFTFTFHLIFYRRPSILATKFPFGVLRILRLIYWRSQPVFSKPETRRRKKNIESPKITIIKLLQSLQSARLTFYRHYYNLKYFYDFVHHTVFYVKASMVQVRNNNFFTTLL